MGCDAESYCSDNRCDQGSIMAMSEAFSKHCCEQSGVDVQNATAVERTNLLRMIEVQGVFFFFVECMLQQATNCAA